MIHRLPTTRGKEGFSSGYRNTHAWNREGSERSSTKRSRGRGERASRLYGAKGEGETDLLYPVGRKQPEDEKYIYWFSNGINKEEGKGISIIPSSTLVTGKKKKGK